MEGRFTGPPSPDYIPGPEEPQSPPPPDFVLEPVYPKFMPPEDEILPAEEQPLPAADSPTADSPGYIPESDPKEDPKEDDDEDPEENPADYPADGGDDGDDEDEPSDDDEDEEVDIEADDEEEEEHPAPADSTAVALPAIDQAPSAEETEPFETDESAATPPPHPAYRVTARISIPAPVPTPVWSDAEVARLLAISTPPSSPLSPWSSPLPQIPSPPLPPILSPLPDTDEVYTRLDDEQSERQLMASRLNMLYRDRRAHARTARLMETEARMSREAWGRSMDETDLALVEVMSLRTQVVVQQAVITKLQAADRKRQAVITEMLAADRRRTGEELQWHAVLKGLQISDEKVSRDSRDLAQRSCIARCTEEAVGSTF
ncbi:hypothetical protein Tco_0204611 [Tanacetum coccineum]